MTATAEPHLRRIRRGTLIIFLALMAVLDLVVLLAFWDKISFSMGHSAYTAGDCVAASRAHGRLLGGIHLIRFGDETELARQEHAACAPLLEASQAEAAGHPGAALASYAGVVQAPPSDVLGQAARQRAAALLEAYKPAELAGAELCPAVGTLAGMGLLPAERLPELHMACAGLYEAQGQPKQAVEHYLHLLADAPDHPLTGEAEMKLLAQPSVCLSADALRQEPGLASRPDLLPRLYSACAVRLTASNWNIALAHYAALFGDYPDHPQAQQAAEALWSDSGACDRLSSLLAQPAIAGFPDLLPNLYLRCGQAQQTRHDEPRAFTYFSRLLVEFPDHPLAAQVEQALREQPGVCQKTDQLLEQELIANRVDFMAGLLTQCGQTLEAQGEPQSAAVQYVRLLSHFPQHALAGPTQSALLAIPAGTCEIALSLQDDPSLAGQPDLLPNLYTACGEYYVKQSEWLNANPLYEALLTNYPTHALAGLAEQALADSIMAWAKNSGAGTLPPPTAGGSSGSGMARIVVSNDSPERLRFVFRGPEIHVERLPACETCQYYSTFGPSACPEQAPRDEYILPPGAYDVVVESISDSSTSPWIGEWVLSAGQEYVDCFFIMIQ